MRRVPSSVLVREELERLLAEGVDREANNVSALVEIVTRLVVQELLEGEQADALGGRGRYERRREGRGGLRNGYEPGHIRTAERERDESYNVSPQSDVYVVLDDGEARKVDMLRWGFVPGWAKDIKIGNRMINARAESATGGVGRLAGRHRSPRQTAQAHSSRPPRRPACLHGREQHAQRWARPDSRSDR